MMSVELKHHPEEWFFLHNFDIDKVFSTTLAPPLGELALRSND